MKKGEQETGRETGTQRDMESGRQGHRETGRRGEGKQGGGKQRAVDRKRRRQAGRLEKGSKAERRETGREKRDVVRGQQGGCLHSYQ